MSVQIKGVGTIGGIDQGLNTVGVITATSLVGTGVSVVGVITATSFVGSGANLTGIDATKIITGNTQVQTIDTGSDGHIKFTTEGSERARIDSTGWMGAGQTSRDHGGQVAVFKNTSNTNSWLSVNVINNTGIGGIVFGDSDSWSPAYIQYDHSGNFMQFIANAGERLRIDSSGHLHTGYTSSFGADHINILATDGGGISIAQNNSGNATSGTVLGSLSIQGYLNTQTHLNAEVKISGIAAANHTGSSAATDMVFYTKPSSTGPGSAPTEGLRITSDGKLTMSSGTVELQSHMVRVGNRTTSQINAGVSTSTGALTLDTTTNLLKYYANSQWATVKKQVNDGSTQTLAARSAKALLDDGSTTSGVYWLDMHGAYTSGNAKRHYCLQDTSYDGGGWTMLWCMNHGNNFASGSNYSYALNVGSPTSVSDFTAGNWGYDRRNTFTPAANDQFLIRRSDNNDWRRFVVTTWSPTANSISDGWSCTQSTEGTNRGHPYYALGQMYDTGGSAVSGMIHFNGCALGGNCNTGGGDSDGFGDHVNWSSGYSPYNCWGGAFNAQAHGGSPLYWGQSALSQGGSLYLQMFYRRAGTQ